jgi:hypothetical protein
MKNSLKSSALLSGAVLMAIAAASPAMATQCPSGQIFRVSKNICAPKSANLQYLRGGAHKPSKQARQTTTDEVAALRPAYAPQAGTDSGETVVAAEPAPAPAPEKPSPFGALPSVASFR